MIGRLIDGHFSRRAGALRVVLCGAVAALALCGTFSAARAGDDDVSSQQSISDKILNTLGLHDPFAPQYGINYSERSPLVVPPTRELAAAGYIQWTADAELAGRSGGQGSVPRRKRKTLSARIPTM